MNNGIIRTLQIGMGWFPQEPGGLNRFYYDLVRYLPQAGVEFQGMLAGAPNATSDAMRIHAFAPKSSSLIRRWWAARKTASQILRENDIDLVISHFALYTLPVLDLLGNRPLVFHFQGPWALEGRAERQSELSIWLKLQMERMVYQKGTRFIVLSRAFRDILHQTYGIPLEKIHVIPGGVEVSRFAIEKSPAEARSELGWPQDRPIVLAVRRLARRMGLEDLVEAADEVRRHVPDALVLIAGKGALSHELDAQIKAHGLENHVRLLGFVPDEALPTAYRAANLCVVPTVALEGFGLIVAEALAAGTPSLVTPVGGLPEVVEDLSRDLILPGIGPSAIAKGIVSALTGSLRLPTAEACQSFAKARYDWPVITSQVKDVYQEALR